MAKNTVKNALESNKRARAKYNKAHYKSIGATISAEKLEMIEKYCNSKNLTKGTLVKNGIDLYIKENP